MPKKTDTLAPLIRRLTIERFRGIEKLDWFPEPGVNVILGGGDVGKTTILDAIALLLSPTNTTVLSEAESRTVERRSFAKSRRYANKRAAFPRVSSFASASGV